jgi:hypothetical protein
VLLVLAALLWALRGCGILAAGACFYVALFQYTTEQAKTRDRIADWWIKVETIGEQSIALHERFATTLARSTLTRLNWLFGRRMISGQALWTSWMLSSASFAAYFSAMVGIIWLALTHPTYPILSGIHRFLETLPREPPSSEEFSVNFRLLLVLTFGCLCLTPVAALIRRPLLARANAKRNFAAVCLIVLAREVIRVYVSVALVALNLYPGKDTHHAADVAFNITLAPLGLAIGSDIVFIAAIRKALTLIADLRTLARGFLALGLTLLAGVIVILAPFALSRGVPIDLWVVLQGVTALNFLDMLLAAGLLLLVFGLVMHRILWGSISRPLMRLHETIPNRPALLLLGCALLGASWPDGLGYIKSFIAAWIGKPPS